MVTASASGPNHRDNAKIDGTIGKLKKRRTRYCTPWAQVPFIRFHPQFGLVIGPSLDHRENHLET